MSRSRAQHLLALAVPLVRTHGFTRAALAEAATHASSSSSSSTSTSPPLIDAALDALFGPDVVARRTLVRAWMEAGVRDMGAATSTREKGPRAGGDVGRVGDVLKRRLQWNVPVLAHLPEAFALLSTPAPSLSASESGPLSLLLAPVALALPPDPRPALAHAAAVADEACYVSGDTSTGTEWYARRAGLAAAYAAAELHQLASPHTAEAFLDDLLATGGRAEAALADTAQFAGYAGRSWVGIWRSAGLM